MKLWSADGGQKRRLIRAPDPATRGPAPGLAALMAWPVLGQVPTAAEAAGLVAVVARLILAVTTTSRSTA